MLAAVLLIGGFLSFFLSAEAQAADGGPQVTVIEFERTVEPVSERYLRRELNNAVESGSSLAIVTLNTPGGLLDSTRDIVNILLDSPIPVAVYVYPNGAHAASAGTFIGAAANFLVMAPVSNLGAASPVSGDGSDLNETLEAKVREDAAALIRSIAATRGRNADLLERTVLEAKSYAAEEAVELGIADFVASDINDLILKLDGRTTTVQGRSVTLNLYGYSLESTSFGFLDSVLGFFANPNISFLLISVGSLALAVEIFNIGTWIPGTIGVILLAVGFAGVGQLPFSWVGIALIVLAVALFIAEAVVPGFGFWGIAGAVSLVLGGLFLFDFSNSLDGVSLRGVSWWLLAIVGGVALLLVLWLSWQIRGYLRQKPYRSAYQNKKLVGTVAVVSSDELDPNGEVFTAGEFWTAKLVGASAAAKGDEVIVEEVDKLQLIVNKKGASQKDDSQ